MLALKNTNIKQSFVQVLVFVVKQATSHFALGFERVASPWSIELNGSGQGFATSNRSVLRLQQAQSRQRQT